ncbi:uncharacterized protein MEPE_04274 [Melanopsichium pennsylvanicum]|uniref:Uncharacterized protein n=2 Tax=Melanopsichium pennsylvanicum TaxID=63383 RepID=A0AAJ4XMZ9_9BASI|nr:putative protein [Melanopsichium pennsylvanicum 4]SNX85565.1 uncharacterized protein MEPE_04274 [Melanopsichium pennsylvanicum]
MSDAFIQVCHTNPNEARTLRRRRSAASAALLPRPSMLNLGILVPSFETCVLVYVSRCLVPPDAMDDGEQPAPKLIYALFEPNFLVDGASASICKLDRTSWERLRSHVEELRIVALSSRYGDGLATPPTTPISPVAPSRKPDCVFDLTMPTDGQVRRSVKELYLQPSSYASVPARNKDELLEIEIHAPSDGIIAVERTTCLPTQVRVVLQDAEQLISHHGSFTSPAPLGAESKETSETSKCDFGSACAKILELVQCPCSAF